MTEQIETISLPAYLDAVFRKFGITHSPMFRGVKDAANHKLLTKAARTWKRVGEGTMTWKEYETWIAAKMQAFSDKSITHAEHQPSNIFEMWLA
jgi:hypothetical protein